MRKKKVKSETNVNRVYYYYDLFQQPYDKSDTTQVLAHTLMIEKIEEGTGFDFRNTRDFERKMEAWFEEHRFTGDGLKKARLRDKLTQQELADKLNISRSQITYVETNQRKLSKDMIDYIVGIFKEPSIESYYCVGVPLWYSVKIDKELHDEPM